MADEQNLPQSGTPEAACEHAGITPADYATLLEETVRLRREVMELRRGLKLYMIRLQNGNSVVLQAKSEGEAIESAGLLATVNEMVRTGRDGKPEPLLFSPDAAAEMQMQLMENGWGPQNFTIRELTEFQCEFYLEDHGDFNAQIEGEKPLTEFMKDYPDLLVAEYQAGDFMQANKDRWKFEEIPNPTHQEVIDRRIPFPEEVEFIREGVLKERTRLTAKL